MANSMLNDLVGRLGDGGVAQIASSLGADQGTTRSAIEQALPALLGGLAGNAESPGGADALSSALDDHSGSVFDQLGGLLGSGGGDGAKILGHVLGGKQGAVEQKLAGNSGLDLGSISKLLPILAPLVMGYLGDRKKSDGLDAGGLGSLLGTERRQAEATSPGLGGLASILDSDGDGSIVDDVIDLTKGGGSKGGIGSILGRLLRR
ncbi:MAG: DUF937 domain-containing protein [Acidimicrobiales bacterium]